MNSTIQRLRRHDTKESFTRKLEQQTEVKMFVDNNLVHGKTKECQGRQESLYKKAGRTNEIQIMAMVNMPQKV